MVREFNSLDIRECEMKVIICFRFRNKEGVNDNAIKRVLQAILQANGFRHCRFNKYKHDNIASDALADVMQNFWQTVNRHLKEHAGSKLVYYWMYSEEED